MANAGRDRAQVERKQQEKLLKLVTKGFYTELINYGVPESDIVTVATHLLGHVSQQEAEPRKQDRFYSRIFSLESIADQWSEAQAISVDDAVRLRPLTPELHESVGKWLAEPKTKAGFVTPYPSEPEALAAHFADPSSNYFCIEYEGEAVGIIGAEKLDPHSRRLEMRKLVGRHDLQGMGIGKRATFAFLYWAFRIQEYEKVYTYSSDVNLRNLNINAQFGFTLEGVLLGELAGEHGRVDVIRMGLLRTQWEQIFVS